MYHIHMHSIESQTYYTFTYKESLCVGCLYILLLLQFYWFALILKVLYGVITKVKAEDVRSDSDDEDEDEEGKEGTKKKA